MGVNENLIFEVGRVISINDEQGGGRVRIRTTRDRTVSMDEIPYAFPLLPKHVNIIPKLGEYCVVLAISNVNRFYIGPIITNLANLKIEDTLLARTFLDEGMLEADMNPRFVRNSEGVYPEENGDDVALLGRNNTDVILKDNEVWVRAGQFEETESGKVFSRNPTYLHLRNAIDGREYTDGLRTIPYKTSSVLVGDEIALISTNKNAKQHFGVADPNQMINDEDMQDILQRAHKLPYGDMLVDFLKQFVRVFSTHTHNAPITPPVMAPDVLELIETSNTLEDDILSNNIRIN